MVALLHNKTQARKSLWSGCRNNYWLVTANLDQNLMLSRRRIFRLLLQQCDSQEQKIRVKPQTYP